MDRLGKLGKKDMDALVERLSQGTSLYDLTLHRAQALDGTISERWQIDNDEDLRLFRKNQTWANAAEVAAIGALDLGEIASSRPSRPQVAQTIALDKVRDGWLASIQSGNPPAFSVRQKWSYAAIANFIAGVIPPSAMLGRSWLYVHSQRVALS